MKPEPTVEPTMHSSVQYSASRSIPFKKIARFAQIIGFIFASAVSTRSQTESVPKPEAESDIVNLSPFVVSSDTDNSWVANTTLAANRTNQEIAKVPATISALTSDFLRDLN